MKNRKYTQTRRARAQEHTRERIVDAAIALHEELGPEATTISALAERAGVQRLTVYRHFADEREILKACSSKWFGQHPPPSLESFRDAEDRERPRRMLGALYAYYDETQGMWASLYRDLPRTPALREPMTAFHDYQSAFCRELRRALAAPSSVRLRATLSHAAQFSTWQSLAAQGLKLKAMTDLVCDWIAASAG